jgi:hypothetical protein
MNTRLVPSLQEILYRLVNSALGEAAAAPRSDNPGRFPVVVRPETRAFLEAQAKRLGGSIAGVAGAILDGVAMSTQHRDGGAAAMKGITERFNLLIQEHGLSFPGAVEALQDLGLSLKDFASTDTLQLRLSAPFLRALADRFFVRYEWLAGKDDMTASASAGSWYKNVEGAATELVKATQAFDDVELSLLVKEGSDLADHDDEQDWQTSPHFVPVLRRSKHLPSGETLDTYELWEEGRWSYWRCRQHIKLLIYFATKLRDARSSFHITGRTAPKSDYDSLLAGNVLPATIMREAQRISWHPDDYVIPESAVAKDVDEWQHLRQEESSRRTLEHFTQQLQTLQH